jgi:hypothetical protein
VGPVSIATTLAARLKAVTGVSNLVSTRVWADRAPRATPHPYVVLQRIGGEPIHHLANASGLANATVQIDVFASSGSSRDAVAEAVRDAIDGWSGSQGGVLVQEVTLDPPVETQEGEDLGREVPIFRARIDGEVFFELAAPSH